MTVLLTVLAIVALLAGGGILLDAKSANHQIAAFVLFLIFAVFISGVGIIQAVNLLRREMAATKLREGSD